MTLKKSLSVFACLCLLCPALVLLAGCNNTQFEIDGQVYDYDVQNLKISDTVLFSFEDLQKCKSLESLTLKGNCISSDEDIVELSKLTGLKKLHIKGVNLSEKELSPLANLTELEELTLTDCEITQANDISFISSLKNLSKLDLSYNKICDISCVSTVKNLWYLNLSNNYIESVSAVGQLENMEKLYLDNCNNKTDDISVIGNLKKLTTLSLNKCALDDISFVSELTELRELFLNDNPDISDLTPLSKLDKLEVLLCNQGSVSDLQPLSNLKSLRNLHIYAQDSNDLSPLAGAVNLEDLYIYGETDQLQKSIESLQLELPACKIHSSADNT